MPYWVKINQGPSGSKVPRLDMCRCMPLLSKIAHQMWRDHQFSQRSSATEKAVGERGSNYESYMLTVHRTFLTP